MKIKITIPCLGSSRTAIQLKMYHWSDTIAEFGKCAFGCGYQGRVTSDNRIYRHVPRWCPHNSDSTNIKHYSKGA